MGSRPGDWVCPKCNNLNYASRQQCNIPHCAFPKPVEAGGQFNDSFATPPPMEQQQPTLQQGKPAGQRGDPNNWWCPMCKNENFPSRTQCNRKDCNFPRPVDVTQNWICPVCNNDNYPNRMVCNNKQCALPRPGTPMQQQQAQQVPQFQTSQPQMVTSFSSPYGYDNGGMQQQQQQGFVQQQPQQIINQPGMGIPMHTKTPPNARPGDWLCPMCNNHNYASRDICNVPNCGQRKPLAQYAIIQQTNQVPQYATIMQPQAQMQQPHLSQVQTNRPGGRVGDWICPKCRNHNYASREVCNSPTCQQRKIDSMRWVCPTCQNDNFPEREVCNLKDCQTPKPANPQLVNDKSEIQGKKRSKPGDPDNWLCPVCGNENFPTRTVCNMPNCREPRNAGDGGIESFEKRQRVVM